MDINIKFNSDKNAWTFMNLLAWMELCGSIGHTANFNTAFVGSGAAEFKADFGDQQEMYNMVKQNLLNTYSKHGDVKKFIFE